MAARGMIAKLVIREEEDGYEILDFDLDPVQATFRLIPFDPQHPERESGIEATDPETTRLIPYGDLDDWEIRVELPDPDRSGRQVTTYPFSATGWTILQELSERDPQAGEWLDLVRQWKKTVLLVEETRPEMVTPRQVTTALSLTALEAMGPVDLPPTATLDGLGRLLLARQMQNQILAMRGERYPAAHAGEWLKDLDFNPLTGTGNRLAILQAREDNEGDIPVELRSRQAVAAANQRLVGEVFAGLTTCRPENLVAGANRDPALAAELVANLEKAGAREVSQTDETTWGPIVKNHLEVTLGRYFGTHYQPECRLFTTPGEQDVLVVGDKAGSYFYSWPSQTRRTLIATGDNGEMTLAAGPEDFPTPDDVMNLKILLQECRQEIANEIEPEAGDHIESDPPAPTPN
ncbi:MAG: hypothetical protein OXH65_03175 [Paracoccaceae bacterium]|nr:hypothetical protein [Paracoccaceae bacterium]